MPWTKRNYPDSLKNFAPRTRNKAVEIANALLEEGYEEGRAISIATAQAKEWASNHPDRREQGGGGGEGDGRNLHVVPHDEGWAIKTEGANKPRDVFDTKREAVEEARRLASGGNVSAIVHRKDGTVETSHNYH